MKLLNLKKEGEDGEKLFRKKEKKDNGKIKEKKTLLSKSLNIVGIVICVLLIPILVINGVLLVKTIIHPDTPPDFMGYIPLVVGDENTSSMFDGDDLVIIKIPDDADQLEIGNTISFWTIKGDIVTHRIVDTELSDDLQVMYVTKGDTNDSEDYTRVAPGQIVGAYVTHIDDLGTFVLFMQTPTGIITLVVLPLVALLVAFYLIDRKRYAKLLKQEHENGGQANANEEAQTDKNNAVQANDAEMQSTETHVVSE